jgi:DNA invertase Pin-like site-specific DNA recombinase
VLNLLPPWQSRWCRPSAPTGSRRPPTTCVGERMQEFEQGRDEQQQLVGQLAERGIGLRVLDQGIDTTTAAGKMMFTVLEAVAEFERNLISERTLDGLEAARARGRKGGRPSKLTSAKLRTARQLYDSKEHTVQEIADIVGVGRSTLYRQLTEKPAASTAGVKA